MNRGTKPRPKADPGGLTFAGVVDDGGGAVGPVALHVERLDLHLELPHLEVLLGGLEVGVPVHVAPGLRVRDGLVPPVVRIVGLEGHDVAKLLAREVPGFNGLRGRFGRRGGEGVFIELALGSGVVIIGYITIRYDARLMIPLISQYSHSEIIYIVLDNPTMKHLDVSNDDYKMTVKRLSAGFLSSFMVQTEFFSYLSFN